MKNLIKKIFPKRFHKFYEKIRDNVKTVPQVFIDDKRIGGFQDLKVFLDE